MKRLTTVSFICLSLLAGGVTAWFLRGMYDGLFLWEGRCHVVSNAGRDHQVTLRFPSDEEVNFLLERDSSVDLQLPHTGEGSISVFVDGRLREHVGYVTSMNGIVVLVVGDERTTFSQIFSSLSPAKD